MGQKAAEFLFVQRFIVGLLRGDSFHAKVLHNGIVERLISHFFADLNHARNLVRLAFAHQVGDGGGENEDLKRSDTALFVNALEQVLGDDTFEGLGQRCADLVLLLSGENVNDAVHGLNDLV